MNASGFISLGRWQQVPLRLHWSFPLLLPFLYQVQPGSTWERLGIASVLLVLLGFSVVFHELAHARMARRYGIETQDIRLYPIGGIARFSTLQVSPGAEFWISLAGPVASLLLAFAALGLWWCVPQLRNLASHGWDPLLYLGLLNLLIGLFNLIPAFPLDGGRMLRAGLSKWLGGERATWWASGLGRAFAALLFGLGLVFQPLWCALGVFLWMAAREEYRLFQIRKVLTTTRACDLMRPWPQALSQPMTPAQLWSSGPDMASGQPPTPEETPPAVASPEQSAFALRLPPQMPLLVALGHLEQSHRGQALIFWGGHGLGVLHQADVKAFVERTLRARRPEKPAEQKNAALVV